MVRFLHSADWQIGKPYARVPDPEKRARLKQVRFEAIARLGAVAMAEQVAKESREPVVRRLAPVVVDTQTRENAEMPAWKPAPAN